MEATTCVLNFDLGLQNYVSYSIILVDYRSSSGPALYARLYNFTNG